MLHDPILLAEIGEASTDRTMRRTQIDAIVAGLTRPLTVVTGASDQARLHVLRVLSRIWTKRNRGGVLRLAGTNKAASRMTDMGMSARTVHAALGWDPAIQTFERGMLHPLEADLILVDYADMVPMDVLSLLMAAKGRANVVLTRDPAMIGSTIPASLLDIDITPTETEA